MGASSSEGFVMHACEQCEFWQNRGSTKEGWCRRNAPTAIPTPTRAAMETTWPVTLPWDWCGEFKARPLDGLTGATPG